MINFVQFFITLPIIRDWQHILVLLFIAELPDKVTLDFFTPSGDVIISERNMPLISIVSLSKLLSEANISMSHNIVVLLTAQ